MDSKEEVHMSQTPIDKDILALVPAFLQRREQDVALLKDLIELREFEAVAAMGHKLKGNGAAFGFPEISETGLNLELAAKARDLEAARRCIRHFEEILIKTKCESHT